MTSSITESLDYIEASEPTEFSYWRLLRNVLIFNAVVGLTIHEIIWYRTRRYRLNMPKIDEYFPIHVRTDAKQWNKLEFMIGSALFLVPKIVLLIIAFVSIIFWSKVLLIGRDFSENRPMSW